MKRRAFLTGSGTLFLATLTGCGGSSNNDTTSPQSPASYAPLKIPPLREGADFDLSLQEGAVEFLEGLFTPTWGIDGDFLGPALRVRTGDAIRLAVTNNLPEATTLHWHGMRLPGPMDGGPHQIIQPGETWLAEYEILQGAGTNWFHPHREGVTGEHVYRGLAGLLIVEDGSSESLDLPRTWGEDDIPLILQDRRFNADGTFDYLSQPMEEINGMLGDTYLVNGTLGAGIRLPAKEVRFRILNGSNAREYDLRFSDGRTFRQIATDNALLEQAATLTRLRLTPGERAEIVVDLGADLGNTLTLVNADDGNAPLLVLDVADTPSSVTTTPDTLTTLEHLDPLQALTTRTFRLDMQMGLFTINGVAMDMERIDQVVPLGAVEIWEIINETNMLHNFHVHGTHFEILDRNGSPAQVEAYEAGYKDTVRVGPSERVRIILRMEDYTTDENAPYMFHCHILEHEDRGMMGQFIVV